MWLAPYRLSHSKKVYIFLHDKDETKNSLSVSTCMCKKVKSSQTLILAREIIEREKSRFFVTKEKHVFMKWIFGRERWIAQSCLSFFVSSITREWNKPNASSVIQDFYTNNWTFFMNVLWVYKIRKEKKSESGRTYANHRIKN